MSQFTDEQIQQLLEMGKSLPDTVSSKHAAEAKLYQQLFKELKKELPVQPCASFSDRVMSQIDGVESAPTKSATYSWFWASLSICLLVPILLLVPVDLILTDLQSVLAMLKPMKWGIIFGLLSLLLIQMLDFKLIRVPSLPKLS